MQKSATKTILILGSGFCGLTAAKKLAKKLAHTPHKIILLDRQPIQTYHADLYEVATAYNAKITDRCLARLTDSVGIGLKKTLRNSPNLLFLSDEVVQIDPFKKLVFLKKHHSLAFDYLVMALGSITNYYNIPGLKEQALSLKTIDDALQIDCYLDNYFQKRWQKKTDDKVYLTIGGGGSTGVELACELVGYLKKLGLKYKFNPQQKIALGLIETTDCLAGLTGEPLHAILTRLRALGVQVRFNTKICRYDGQKVTLSDITGQSQKIRPADILIWTGGIQPSPILKSFNQLDKTGALEVKDTLQSIHYPNIYAGGDNATIFDKNHQVVPKLAQFAVKQGAVIAHNIWADIMNKPAKKFVPHFKGIIIPLGSKSAIYHRGWITWYGFIPYLLRKLVDLNYFMKVLSPWEAVKKWYFGNRVFAEND